MHTSSIEKSFPVSIGDFPYTREELSDALDEFVDLYKHRPVADNSGGMDAPQMFGAWFMAKKIQPRCIVESGVWYGQGTWFFEQAAPDAVFVCIEPSPDRIRFRSKKAQYITNDFAALDWSQWADCENTMCFFDDHQNALQRVKIAHDMGFKHLMFEDNYPITQGDCVSLKTVLEVGGPSADNVRPMLDVYYEFPPVVKGDTTRWGDDWSDEVYPTHPPLLTEYSEKYAPYFDGYQNYTWICYAKVK